MGVYRAQMNTPILRFGKTALLSDTDPLVEGWLASGALVRIDDVSDAPIVRDKSPVVKVREGLVDESVGVTDADEVEPKVEVEVKPKVEPRKPGRPKGVGGAAKPTSDNSGLNPTFGIQFDDDDN